MFEMIFSENNTVGDGLQPFQHPRLLCHVEKQNVKI